MVLEHKHVLDSRFDNSSIASDVSQDYTELKKKETIQASATDGSSVFDEIE